MICNLIPLDLHRKKQDPSWQYGTKSIKGLWGVGNHCRVAIILCLSLSLSHYFTEVVAPLKLKVKTSVKIILLNELLMNHRPFAIYIHTIQAS